jgi:hypothetical protein
MAELVDAPASGAGAGNGVEVRVLFRAPFFGLSVEHFQIGGVTTTLKIQSIPSHGPPFVSLVALSGMAVAATPISQWGDWRCSACLTSWAYQRTAANRIDGCKANPTLQVASLAAALFFACLGRGSKGSRRESVVCKPFKDLFKRRGNSLDLQFVTEHAIVTPKGKRSKEMAYLPRRELKSARLFI